MSRYCLALQVLSALTAYYLVHQDKLPSKTDFISFQWRNKRILISHTHLSNGLKTKNHVKKKISEKANRDKIHTAFLQCSNYNEAFWECTSKISPAWDRLEHTSQSCTAMLRQSQRYCFPHGDVTSLAHKHHVLAHTHDNQRIQKASG